MTTVVLDRILAAQDPAKFSYFENLASCNLHHLSQFYPDFPTWYSQKVENGLHTGQRIVLLKYVGKDLGGIAILKDTKDEKKLCCLRVLPAFEGSGIGIRLFAESMERLKTERPLLSVSEEQAPKFERVFRHFGFELARKYRHLYRQNRTEFSFNGLLNHNK